MANVLSLALKINADASGLKLDPVSKALRQLGEETDKVSSIFDKFTGTSEAAARAQAATEQSLNDLIAARKAGTVTAQEFADSFKAVEEAAKQQAATFERGAEVTRKYTTEEEKRAASIAELDRLLKDQAITEETYQRALEDVSGSAAAAAEAERQRQSLMGEGASLTERFSTAEEKRAVQLARVEQLLNEGVISEETAARARREFSGEAEAAAAAEKVFADQKAAAAKIIEANLSSVERAQKTYDAAIKEAQDLERAGLLTKEQFIAEVARQAEILNKATAAADGNADATSKQALKFNELSGIFAALPGPLGDIAGRISGLTSAGEGLSRVFSGGLSAGFSSIGSALAGLVNPFTVAAAGVAAFGAAATAVVSGLTNLEDRVEKLGNTADKLGTSFEFVQVLDEAARRSGTSIDTVSAAFGRLQKSLLGVDEESKSAQTALASIGVTAEELKSLDPQQQYLLIGEALGKIEDPAKRSATATQLFGKAGAELLPFFSNIPGAADDMDRFSATLSDLDKQRVDDLGGAFDRVFVAIRGLGQNLLTPFAGLVEGLADIFSTAIGIITDVFVEPLGDLFTPVLDLLGSGFSAAANAIGSAFEAASSVISRISTIITTAISLVVGQFLEFTGLGSALQGIGSIISSVFGSVAGVFGTIASAIGGTVGRLLSLAESFLGIERSTKSASDATESLAGSADSAAKSADDLSKSQKKAADEADRRAKEAAKIASEEAKRVNELLDLQEPIDKLSQDITATNNEIVRTEAALADARAAGATEEANRLTARLAKLDQLQQSLIDKSEEAAQGFNEGFDKAFADVDKGIGGLIDKASDFGNEGALAASQLTAGIEKAKAAVKDGILNKNAFDAEVARQKELFDDRVKGLQEAAKITEKAYEKEAELLQKQFEIEKERAEELAAIRTGAVQVGDIRSGGIDQFFDTLKEDPAVAEAKKQRKELEKIRQEISKLNAEKIEILAGTG